MKKVLIWGTGKIAERCAKRLRGDVEIIAYVQSNADETLSFNGKKVLPGGCIAGIDYDYIILANTHEEEIITSFCLDEKELIYWRAVEREECQDIHGLFRFPDGIYMSFGENCLTDNLLERYGVKSFATPYSHGRSNIEYINAIEQDGFVHLLEKEYLSYCDRIGGEERR